MQKLRGLDCSSYMIVWSEMRDHGVATKQKQLKQEQTEQQCGAHTNFAVHE